MPRGTQYKRKKGQLGPKGRKRRRGLGQSPMEVVAALNRLPASALGNFRIGGFRNIENKFLDSELTATATATTWASLNPTGTGCTDSISVPAQGTGESDRDGRQYTINSIHVRGRLSLAAAEAQAAPLGDEIGRVIIYWDTQTNSTEATATEIMDGGLTEDWLAFRNLQNSKRFIVLYDKTIRLRPALVNEGAADAFAAGPVTIPWKFNKSFKKGIQVTCDNTTANVSSVSDNNIGVAAVSTSANVLISYQARIRFSG